MDHLALGMDAPNRLRSALDDSTTEEARIAMLTEAIIRGVVRLSAGSDDPVFGTIENAIAPAEAVIPTRFLHRADADAARELVRTHRRTVASQLIGVLLRNETALRTRLWADLLDRLAEGTSLEPVALVEMMQTWPAAATIGHALAHRTVN